MKKVIGNLVICSVIFYLAVSICNIVFGSALGITILIPVIFAILATVIGDLYSAVDKLEKRILELEEGSK